jgi:hypothetical protein
MDQEAAEKGGGGWNASNRLGPARMLAEIPCGVQINGESRFGIR